MELHSRIYGDGPALIILHGLFGSSDNWHSMARCWSQKFQVHALDQRNHGNSPHASGMNYNLLSQDLLDYMNAENLESALIVGHSMGGKTAMTFADQFPDRVTGLVILDIGIKQYEQRHSAILEALRKLDLTEFSTRSEVDEALQTYIDSPAVRLFLIKNIRRDKHDRFQWKFNHRELLLDYPKLLAEIPMAFPFDGPTLFIRGGASDYIPDRDWPVLQNFFPQAEFFTLTDAGHWLHAEEPDEICRLVEEFGTRSLS